MALLIGAGSRERDPRENSPNHSAISFTLGIVADRATNLVAVPSVLIRDTNTSSTAPRTSAPTKCTSSMQNSWIVDNIFEYLCLIKVEIIQHISRQSRMFNV